MSYLIWNSQDGFIAHPETFEKLEDAKKTIREMVKGYERQGYYRNNKWEQIPLTETIFTIKKV